MRKKSKMPKKFFKQFIMVWLFIFLFLGVAFSSYTGTLAAEGTAVFQAHLFDYVYITHVSISDSSGAASIQYSFLDHELNANISATTCNSYVTYALDIVNTTPYKAFITANSIKSMVNGSGNTTNTLSVELTDVTLNSTYIDPHSTKTIHVKIKNNCNGSDEQVRIKTDFEYSLYRYFDLTVNCNPNDATASITTTEGTFTGSGSVTHRVKEGETVSYKCSKKYYYDNTGSYTMGTLDHTETLTLEPDPHRDLTINATPNSSTIIVKQDGDVVCSGEGTLTCSVISEKDVTYTVDDPEYYYTYTNNVYSGYEETFTMPTTEVTKNITLNERPWITGTVSNSSNTSAKNQTSINWHSGYYLVEVWGGKGGNGNQTPGSSGYVYGVVYVPYNNYVIMSAGGNGSSSNSSPSGGANGGGSGGYSGSGNGGNKGGGGGYSSVIISSSNSTTISTTSVNNGYVKFIAGGGGGASSKGGTFGSSNGGNGGNGGNMSSSVSSITAGKVFSGANGTSNGNNDNTPGGGGNTSAGEGGSGADDGAFLKGGNGDERGGGGGAGYYGGGGGGVSSIFATAPGGGGGGSSFIAKDITFSGLPSSITSKLTSSNPSSTGGAIKIQWIGKNM